MKQFNDNDRALTEALRALAAEDAGLAASNAVEAGLLGEVRSMARARRRRLAIAALAAAAGLVIAAAVPWRRGAGNAPAGPQPTTSVPRGGEVATAFFPLTYSSLPISNAQLIRVQVPRSALASFGLAPIDVPAGARGTASTTVPADVLVGEDGVARAVRFVSPTP